MVSWALQQLVCAYMCPIAPLHDDSSKKSMNEEMKKKKRKVNTDQVNTLTRSVLLSYLYYIPSSPAWWDILAFFHTPEVSSEKHQTVLSSTPICCCDAQQDFESASITVSVLVAFTKVKLK